MIDLKAWMTSSPMSGGITAPVPAGDAVVISLSIITATQLDEIEIDTTAGSEDADRIDVGRNQFAQAK
jgi:hypothetical protein